MIDTEKNTNNDMQEVRNKIIIVQQKKQRCLKKLKIVFLVLLEIIGIVALFFSITTFSGYLDSFPTFMRPDYEYYGGDAYTGIQNSTADVAENVAEAGDILKNLIYDFSYTMGGTLLIVALLILLVATYLLIKACICPIVVDKNLVDSLVEQELSQRPIDQ